MNRNKFYLFLILFFLESCSTGFPEIPPGATHKFHATDFPDSFVLLTVPNKYESKRPTPVLIALHGSGDRAEAFHDFWKKSADSLGLILVTPQGLEKMNMGFGWNRNEATERYIKNVLVDVRKRIQIDSTQIYFAGFSSGGSLAAYLTLKKTIPNRGAILFGASLDTRSLLLNSGEKYRFYIGHGTLEQNYPHISSVADTLAQSGHSVRFVPYPNIGHTIPEPKHKELLNALRWILEK